MLSYNFIKIFDFCHLYFILDYKLINFCKVCVQCESKIVRAVVNEPLNLVLKINTKFYNDDDDAIIQYDSIVRLHKVFFYHLKIVGLYILG